RRGSGETSGQGSAAMRWDGDGARQPDGRRPSRSDAARPARTVAHSRGRLSLRQRYATELLVGPPGALLVVVVGVAVRTAWPPARLRASFMRNDSPSVTTMTA